MKHVYLVLDSRGVAYGLYVTHAAAWRAAQECNGTVRCLPRADAERMLIA
jgi:hypothetical protein